MTSPQADLRRQRVSRAPATRAPQPPPASAPTAPTPQLPKILPWPEKSRSIDGQAVALQTGKARAAGSTSKGPFTLKRCKTVRGSPRRNP